MVGGQMTATVRGDKLPCARCRELTANRVGKYVLCEKCVAWLEKAGNFEAWVKSVLGRG